MNQRFSTVFSSVQWMFFIFANTIVTPISIAAAFNISDESTAIMLKMSLIFTGLLCVFQGLYGHKYPIMDGHSALTWGLMLNLVFSASSLGLSLTEIGGGITTGVLLASAVTLLLVAFNGIPLIKWIFSHMVISVSLFLLFFQLIFIFFKQIFVFKEDGSMYAGATILSIAIILLVTLLKVKGNTFVSNFSILIGLMVGWIIFAIFFDDNSASMVTPSLFAFELFPLGAPNLQWGIIAVSFFAGLLNLANTVSTVVAGEELYKNKISDGDYRRSIFITTLFTIVGTGFGLVSYTSYTSAFGFLHSTRIYDRKPYLYGGAIVVLIGCIPPLTGFLSTMPMSIGSAVLLVAYLQLFGTAYSSLNLKTFNSNTILRLAIPIMVGLGLMNIDPSTFSSLPILVQPFITNGLIMGILVSIIIEKTIKWKNYE